MATTRTVTKEYDAEGRLVKETEVTVTTPDATRVYRPQPYVYPSPYVYSGTWSTGGVTTNRATLTLIGEAGPEAVIPRKPDDGDAMAAAV